MLSNYSLNVMCVICVCVCVWCHPGLTLQPSNPASAPQQRSGRRAEQIGALQIRLFPQQLQLWLAFHSQFNIWVEIMKLPRVVSPKLEQTGVFPSPLLVILYTTNWWKCGFTAVIFSCPLKLPGALWEVCSGHSGHKHPALTLVTATLAPLFISWTTLSACPLCDATRRCSESVRTSAASSWLMKQRRRCWNSQTGARGHTEVACHPAELWPSCCRKQHRHLASAANFKDDFPPSSAATTREETPAVRTGQDGPDRRERNRCNPGKPVFY